MTEPALEPYALQQTWSMPRPIAGAEWTRLFCEYLATLARGCADAGEGKGGPRVLIGHIKLLALFGEREYLRVSVVSPTHPLTVTGVAPNALAEVKTTLNILVYGLAAEQLAELTLAAAGRVAAQWGATVQEDEHHHRPDRSSETCRVPLDDEHLHYHHENNTDADQP